jgi:hypothetical protein
MSLHGRFLEIVVAEFALYGSGIVSTRQYAKQANIVRTQRGLGITVLRHGGRYGAQDFQILRVE